MGLVLIQDDTFYKKKTEYNGQWVNGVYMKEETITYEEITGLIDPYQLGEKSFVLPEGVGSSDAYLLYSNNNLVVHKSLPSGSHLADIVYLDDPEENTDVDEYTVYDKMDWRFNKGFTLMGGHNEYLLIRKSLV